MRKTDSGAKGDGVKRCLFARRAKGDSQAKRTAEPKATERSVAFLPEEPKAIRRQNGQQRAYASWSKALIAI